MCTKRGTSITSDAHLMHVTDIKMGKKCNDGMKNTQFRVLNRPRSVRGAQRAVGSHGDAMRVAVVDQLLLGQVRVAFDLRGWKRDILFSCDVTVNIGHYYWHKY